MNSYIVTTVKGNRVDIIKDAESLDVFERQKLYLKNYIWDITERYNFHITIKENGIEFSKWTMIHPYQTFEEYCSKENIIEVKHGDKWKEQGFATASRTEFSGLYLDYLHTK